MYLEFKKERDVDFMNAYHNVIRSYGKQAIQLSRDVLIQATIHSQAKRYYVSYEQALRIISKMLRGKEVLFRNDLKKEMYTTILKEVKIKLTKDQSLKKVLSNIIYSPAPRFHISKESAFILYYSLLKS